MKEFKIKISFILFLIFKSRYLRFWQALYAWSGAKLIEVNKVDVFYKSYDSKPDMFIHYGNKLKQVDRI